MRLHIGIFGRRNAGKSSLLNALTGQEVAIVSPTPGTTTDVVEKPMELQPLGPVLILDTAGLDDVGELGGKRAEKSRAALDRVELVLLVVHGEWSDFETRLADELRQRKLPVIVVFAQSDRWHPTSASWDSVKALQWDAIEVSALTGAGLPGLRELLVRHAPQDFLENKTILADLVHPGDLIVLVVPIDLEAPKGRLILPQVQVIREILDSDAQAMVVKERELSLTLEALKRPPHLVVTDSQMIQKVAATVPEPIPLTGFSVLYARWKGDLAVLVEGAKAVDHLRSGDQVLILEACTHHPIGEDIGRVKIPRWLNQYTGGGLRFEHYSGHDLPANLSDYRLIVHCGACMHNRREMLARILRAQAAGVPITNYGLVIAKSQGLLKRMLSPFPQWAERM